MPLWLESIVTFDNSHKDRSAAMIAAGAMVLLITLIMLVFVLIKLNRHIYVDRF